MPSPTFRLTSDFAVPAGAPTIQRTVGNVSIEATSVCIGHAAKVCQDIESALLYGAIPTAQLVMVDRVQKANGESLPLSCALSFGS